MTHHRYRYNITINTACYVVMSAAQGTHVPAFEGSESNRLNPQKQPISRSYMQGPLKETWWSPVIVRILKSSEIHLSRRLNV